MLYKVSLEIGLFTKLNTYKRSQNQVKTAKAGSILVTPQTANIANNYMNSVNNPNSANYVKPITTTVTKQVSIKTVHTNS